MSALNYELIEELTILLDKAKLNTDKNDRFRVKSYTEAISKIKELDYNISKIEDIPLKKTSKIYQKIVEFLERGQITQSQKALEESKEIITFFKELEKVAGIGPVKAKELYQKYGIKSISDLEKNMDLLNDKQKIGMKYYITSSQRIPRDEIKKHQAFFQEVIDHNKYCNDLQFQICGSFRRGFKDSGDIDVLVTHPEDDSDQFIEFVESLIAEGYITDRLAFGDKKFMGYGKMFQKDSIPRRIDIIYCTPEEYPFALLYFTGSGTFNIKMRDFISKRGFKLNERNLVNLKTGKQVKGIKTEREIFDYFDLGYVLPTDRKEDYRF